MDNVDWVWLLETFYNILTDLTPYAHPGHESALEHPLYRTSLNKLPENPAQSSTVSD